MKKKIFITIFFILSFANKSLAYSSDPKQFIQEITNELKKVNSQAEQKIKDQMDSIPDVMDSKQILKG